MELLTFFGAIGLVYGALLFFDRFFKSCMHYPYAAFLRGTGLEVHVLSLRWMTTAFNRTIVRWGTACPHLFSESFEIGVYVTLLLMPISFAVVVISAFSSAESGGQSDSLVRMEVLLPAVNLPLNEIWYFIVAMAICSIVHEMGHAIAAVLDDVPVTGFGVFVYMVFPAAFTCISSEHLAALRPWRRLRILTAGVWHNICLGGLTYAMFLVAPILFSAVYNVNESVVVTEVDRSSPLHGTRGLAPGDVLVDINSCRVRDTDAWYACLMQAIRKQPEYCVTTDFIHQHEESVPVIHHADGTIDCCVAGNTATACFEHVGNPDDGVLELPQFMCLNIRLTVEQAVGYCSHTSVSTPCAIGFCIKPMMNNATTIVAFRRQSQNDFIIYMGHPADVASGVRVSNFVPTTKLLPPQVADCVMLLLKYLVVFSCGLATLNAVPCFGLDGQQIVQTGVVAALARQLPQKRTREMVALGVTTIGTVMLAVALGKSFWTLALREYARLK